MVFNMKVVINGDPLVFSRMRFGHVIDKGLVLFGREVITGKKVKDYLYLNHWVLWRRFDKPEKKKLSGLYLSIEHIYFREM